MNPLNFASRIARLVGGAALAAAVLAAYGGGGGSDSPPPAANVAPTPAMTIAGVVEAGSGGADVSASAGSDLVLNGGSSTDPNGDVISYKWSISAKPADSKLTLVNDSAVVQTVRADVAGSYVFMLRVSDDKGAFSEKKVTILIRDNKAPVVNVVVTASYAGQSSVKPTQKLNIGAAVVLDGSAVTDADGDPVTTVWTLLEKPAGSTAGLTFDGKNSRFVADVAGQYQVRARGTDPMGAWSESVYVFDASNRAPLTVVVATVTAAPGSNGASTVGASVGDMVAFNGSSSSDPDGGLLSYAWSITSKPAASAVVLGAANGAVNHITPDLLGDYVVKMTVTDSGGATSTYVTTVSVKNRSPIAAISTNATPVALPSGPTVRLPLNTLVTLRGSASSDADGDALSYAWSIQEKPVASTAALSSATGASVTLTPDAAGSYVVKLVVSDTNGGSSERSLIIESGNYAPVAVIDKNRVTVLAGTAATASAALSYDEEGDTLSYQWAVDARPVGSVASIAAPTTSALSFTPDVAGTYVFSVTVNDGQRSSIAYVSVKALASVATSVPLNFAPLEARYSKGLDKLVVVATNPNTVKIIDPFTAGIKTVLLPTGVKSINLSPDGKLAAVLHEGVVSLVDLDAATLLRSTASMGSQTDAFVTNAGLIYMIGQTGGQWVDQAVGVIDGRTGVNLSATLGLGGYHFYGTQRGIYSPVKGKVFLMLQGLSPADIDFFSIDRASGKVTGAGDSPYHGTYNMSTPLFLSGNEDLLFTASGTYFRTGTLQYAGKFTLTGSVLSMSHSADTEEALLMQAGFGGYPNYERSYAASYKRYVGALFLSEADISLPVIDNAQSYGLNIFHSANGNHVALVQTGTATQNGAGVKYYVTTR